VRLFVSRSFSSFGHSERAQTLVEFALSASLFILLLFGIMEFAFLFYAKMTLQNAVRTAGRYAITGNCGSGNCYDNQNPNNRLQTVLSTVRNFSFGLNPTVSIACTGTCSGSYGSGGNNAGGPGDAVRITASYVFRPSVLRPFFPRGILTISCSSSYKNETFPPAS
jgi:hypothetical protein